MEEIYDEKHPEHKQDHHGLVYSIREIKRLVLRIDDGVGIYSVRCFVEEHLSVTETPVAKNKHEKRCMPEDEESIFIELLVVHRWSLVVVCKTEPLDDVHVENSKESDREQKRNAHAVHEAHKDLHNN